MCGKVFFGWVSRLVQEARFLVWQGRFGQIRVACRGSDFSLPFFFEDRPWDTCNKIQVLVHFESFKQGDISSKRNSDS